MILKHKDTGAPVVIGDEVTDFRGEKATVIGWEEPKHSASTGRVYVAVGEGSQGYYPSVYGLYW